MNRHSVTRLVGGLVLLLPVLGPASGLGLPLPWPLGWVMFAGLFVSPAAALTLLLERRSASFIRSMSLHAATAAAIGALLCYGLRKMGLDAEQTVLGLSGLYLVMGIAALPRLRRTEFGWDRADCAFVIAAVLLVAGLWFATHASYRHLLGAHGMWHTACGMKTLEQTPPENPVFAGGTQYLYWGFNLFVAELSLLVGHTFGEVAFALNLLALVALLAASWGLSGCFFGSHSWRWFATLLTVGGLNALGSGWLLLRLVTGQNPWHEYLGPLRLNELGLKYGWYQSSLALGGFHHPGGAGIGLALFVAIVYLTARTLQRGPLPGATSLAFVWTAGATMLHPVSGAVGFAVVLVGLGAATLRPGRADRARQAMVSPALAAVAGMLAVAPHMLEVSGAIEQELTTIIVAQPELLLRHLWDWAGPWLWALPLMPPAIRIGLRRRDAGSLMVSAAAVMLIVAALSVRLAYDNQYKFVYLQAPFIAIMATWVLSAMPVVQLRRLLVGTLLAAAVTTALLGMVMARISDRYEAFFRYQPDGRQVVLDAAGDPGAAPMYAYLRERTPAQSVIIESPVGLQHNTTLLEPAVVGNRTGFTSLCGYWMSGGYADCPARQRIAEKLYRGEALTPDDRALLRALGRPLYLLLRSDNPTLQPHATVALEAEPDLFREVFASESMKLYRMTP